MPLALTPERLAAVYECLRVFPPFSGLHLPPAEMIKFRVTQEEGLHGAHVAGQPHTIQISAKGVGHYNTLSWVMGHEMIHVSQAVRKTTTPGTLHNAEFRRIARRACQKFGWDVCNFGI